MSREGLIERVVKDKDGNPLSWTARTLVACNAPMISCCRPGQWYQPCHCGVTGPSCTMNDRERRRHEETWTVTSEENKELSPLLLSQTMSTIPGNWQPTQVSAAKFSARFLTPQLQWVDVVDATLRSEGEAVNVDLIAGSAAMCPASCLCSPCCSLLCCWFSFKDWGKNKEHVDELLSHLSTVR